jgi:hypothetical protein
MGMEGEEGGTEFLETKGGEEEEKGSGGEGLLGAGGREGKAWRVITDWRAIGEGTLSLPIRVGERGRQARGGRKDWEGRGTRGG